jgi:triacylglycerol lipase
MELLRGMRTVWQRARRHGRDAAARPRAGGAGDVIVRGSSDRCPSPVLLLQGFLSTRRSLEVLERRLRRDGHCVFSLELGGLAGRFNTRRIDELASLVQDEVENLYARHPDMGALTVIGHSEGGLIAVYWVKRLEGHRRVRAVLTLGTPHRGTPLAWPLLPLAPLAPSILQMTPQSGLIRALDERAWPPEVSLTSLYSRQDRLVPYPRAMVDTRGQHQIRNVEVVGTHGDFLLKRGIYREMARAFRGLAGEAGLARAARAAA